MEILETIPIYTSPIWPVIIALIGLSLFIIGVAIIKDTDYAGIIIFIIGLIMLVVGFTFMFILDNTEYSHDEYIIKIDNISTKEFIERYDVTKRFEYSDVVQVKEIENE